MQLIYKLRHGFFGVVRSLEVRFLSNYVWIALSNRCRYLAWMRLWETLNFRLSKRHAARRGIDGPKRGLELPVQGKGYAGLIWLAHYNGGTRLVWRTWLLSPRKSRNLRKLSNLDEERDCSYTKDIEMDSLRCGNCSWKKQSSIWPIIDQASRKRRQRTTPVATGSCLGVWEGARDEKGSWRES